MGLEVTMSYNKRENYEALLAHEPVEWIPDQVMDVKIAGGRAETWENGPLDHDGYDGFGNRWVSTVTSGGAVTPDSKVIPLDDVCDWEDKVHFPDLDAIDWEEYAAQQLAGYDRAERILEYHTWDSIFLRFTHLLSFEEGLCAFYEEPEASMALCNAITDYKIRLVGYIDKYFKPDVIIHYDDTATSKSLFMSPETYRTFIKPCHKRLNDAIRSYGILPGTHVCGYCTDIIPDMIDEGSVTWQSAQPSNDIAHIIEEYGDRISVVGGYDTQGAPGLASATVDEVIAETTRCMEEYGKYGHSFAIFPLIVGPAGDEHITELYKNIHETAVKLGREIPATLRAEGKLPAIG